LPLSTPKPMPNTNQPPEAFPTQFQSLESPPTTPKGPLSGAVVEPIRSVQSWASFGLLIGLAGLMGSWGDGEPQAWWPLLRGGLAAFIGWTLLRGGLGAVKRAELPKSSALGGALLVVSCAFLALGAGEDFMSGGGALLALFGGLLVVAAPSLGGKKDAKLPPPGPRVSVDSQFSKTLLAYLLILGGLLVPWTDIETGVDSMLGVVTLMLALLMVWAAWVGMWKMWQMPVVTGKLGLVLFLAPIEAMILAMMGLLRAKSPDNEGLIANAIQGPNPQLDGPLLVLAGSLFSFYLLFSGAKEAVEINKQKKAEEVAARKAARNDRKK